jgi:hypothetical protein
MLTPTVKCAIARYIAVDKENRAWESDKIMKSLLEEMTKEERKKFWKEIEAIRTER